MRCITAVGRRSCWTPAGWTRRGGWMPVVGGGGGRRTSPTWRGPVPSWGDQRDGAFPQVRWVVAESGTGALIEATFGPYTRGEQSMVADLLSAFTPQMVVLADRNFLSH